MTWLRAARSVPAGTRSRTGAGVLPVRARRTAGALAIGVVLLGAVSGCSVTGCSGARQSTATIAVHATAWSSAHPGHTLSVCLDSTCEDVTADDSITAPSSDPSGHAFRITATDTISEQQVGRVTSRLAVGQESSACGNVSFPTGTVTIGGDGGLRVS
ncbi:hypothetical protein [Curtobacterium sp. 9128]|uniref:hypothetical protein n=1 Tax=Curtobacterium sp. 9128 TaxID=1793722 RepID=UPI0011A67D58|nr:hypothetical protein [Curtobacterium sp. 9128]